MNKRWLLEHWQCNSRISGAHVFHTISNGVVVSEQKLKYSRWKSFFDLTLKRFQLAFKSRTTNCKLQRKLLLFCFFADFYYCCCCQSRSQSLILKPLRRLVFQTELYKPWDTRTMLKLSSDTISGWKKVPTPIKQCLKISTYSHDWPI